MHRFYLPREQWLLAEPQLHTSDAHHALNVLRYDAGDSIIIFDGEGTEALATIVSFKKKGDHKALLSIGTRRKTVPPRCLITLAQAVPKNKNMDLIIQKAVELGTSRIIPLLTERTILKCSNQNDALQKQQRWEQIAIEACKQSGQNWLPQIERPCQLQDFFKMLLREQDHLLLIASLEAEKYSFKKTVMTSASCAKATIMIGPEGDFTSKEYEAAKGVGFQPIDLGSIILRTETAAIYCLSVLSYTLQSE